MIGHWVAIIPTLGTRSWVIMFRAILSASLCRIAIQPTARAVFPSSSCLSHLSTKFQSLSLNNYYKPTSTTFTYNTSFNLFSTGSKNPAKNRSPSRRSKQDKDDEPKKLGSVEKRALQSAKRRTYNRSHKSLVKNRVNQVLESLELLENRPDAQPEDVVPIEELIREAHSVIDKAVKAGTLHWKTGARRKSRLARRKKTVEIHHGWLV